MAERQRGSSPVDFRVPNRTITIPLSLRDVDTTTFAEIRGALQGKVALFQQEGGWLKRVLADGERYVFADIVNASLKLSGGWGQAHGDWDVESEITLEAIPDFYGSEVGLGDHAELTNAELIFTETGIKGDYPGRVRMVVDNDQATDQKGLIWGFRSKNADGAVTAALAYEAEALTPIFPAISTAVAGASGGNAVQLASTPASWTAVMNTNRSGAFLTHKGTYRVLARVAMGTGSASLRLVWDVGDLVNPVENPAWAFPGPNAYYIADLGQVRLEPAPVGPHRWQGQIQARGATGGETVDIDKVWFVPVDEGMGLLSAPVVPQAVSTGIYGPRSGATFVDDATVGTVAWSNPSNAGASDNAYATATPPNPGDVTHYLKATNFGMVVPTSATITGIKVEVERSTSALQSVKDNAVRIVKGGAIQTPSDSPASPDFWPASDAYVTYGGPGYLWPGSGSWTPADVNASGFGVVISAARFGAGTYRIDHICITVYYTTNFSVVPDAVIYASRTAQLTTQGMYRQDTSGTAYGPVSRVVGDLPRIPPSTENRSLEVFLKSSRGDLDTIADAGIDDLSAQLFYRPSWLTISD